jgi:surfactin synthase thioesterase subunit
VRDWIFFGFSVVLAVAGAFLQARLLQKKLGRPLTIWISAMLAPLFLNVAFWLFFELKNWLLSPESAGVFYASVASTLGMPIFAGLLLSIFLPRPASLKTH